MAPSRGGAKELRLEEKPGHFGRAGRESGGERAKVSVHAEADRLRQMPSGGLLPQEGGNLPSKILKLPGKILRQQGTFPGEPPEGAGKARMEEPLEIPVPVGGGEGSQTDGQRGHS